MAESKHGCGHECCGHEFEYYYRAGPGTRPGLCGHDFRFYFGIFNGDHDPMMCCRCHAAPGQQDIYHQIINKNSNGRAAAAEAAAAVVPPEAPAKGSPAKAAGKDEKGARGKGAKGEGGEGGAGVAGPEDPGHAALRQCVVCLDEPPTMACVPCGHMCLCDGCDQHMAAAKASPLCRFQCPLCRLTVQHTMRIYF